MRTITVLGATGSIGDSTLDVVGRNPDRFRVHALTAHSNADKLLELAARHRPEVIALTDPQAAAGVEARMRSAGLASRLAVGPDEVVAVAGTPGIDCVMAAIVGAAGLAPTLAAARHSRAVMLANKEAIVMAGRLFIQTCRQSQVALLPIDSEHNALFQCLPPRQTASTQSVGEAVRRLVLTASGGPFRTTPLDALDQVTPDEACAHPKWAMGRKISVDSATMMNKGLELIEAHYLFDMPAERLDVLIHPQSIVHSLVEYVDGSVLAQLGNPDMRVPIANALGYPDRIPSGATLLDLAAIGRLDFEAPDESRFPCLRLAREALAAGDSAPCVLNAANEVAVAQFLAGRIRFSDIARINQAVLEAMPRADTPGSLDEAMDLDQRSRRLATQQLERFAQ
ncbi:MAG TPA: 1-deoxy-D-xylulose-5-phosphate reductoisomerase [Lautropia sp.]|nr:1-deoxy-D-xylulose-5-phosphate reductoisomerase [Lautropia sp.]